MTPRVFVPEGVDEPLFVEWIRLSMLWLALSAIGWGVVTALLGDIVAGVFWVAAGYAGVTGYALATWDAYLRGETA